MQLPLSSLLAVALASELVWAGATLPTARRGGSSAARAGAANPSSTSTSSSTSSSTSKTTSSTSLKSSLSSTTTSRASSQTIASSTTSSTSSRLSSTTSKSTTTSTVPTTTQKTTTTTTTISTTSAACTTPVQNSGKRGLSFNEGAYTNQYSLCNSNSKVSWAYNWGSDPSYPDARGTHSFNPALVFTPMLWSAASDLTSIWASNIANAASAYRADSLLAFNEPDGCGDGGSCMSVADAVAAYKTWVQPYAGKFALGAPAVTNGVGSGVGLDWLRQFVGNCSGCTIDFVPIHFYGDVGQVSQFTSYVQSAYNEFGKPVWVTEFGTTSGSPAEVRSWLQSAMSFLDGASYVKRYAYFMNAPNSADTWLLGSNASMNALGLLYNS